MQATLNVQYDTLLTVLSYIVAIVPAYGALDLARHARAGGPRARWWMVSAGVTLGFGMWATHFVAALALRTALPVTYDPGLAVLALLVSVGIAVVAFRVAMERKRLGVGQVVVMAALIAGSAVAAHYLGHAALQIPARKVLAPWSVFSTTSIVFIAALIAVGSAYGMKEARGLTRLRRRMVGALVLGVGVAGGHSVGQAATTFTTIPGSVQPIPGVADLFFIGTIAVGASGVLGLVLMATIAESRGDQRQMGYMVAIMSAVALLVGGISGGVAYLATVQTMRASLSETVAIQARLIEAVARFDEEHTAGQDPAAARAATLSQVAEAVRTMPPIGRTGEFVVGVRQDDLIHFVGGHRPAHPADRDHDDPIGRAVRGESGTAIGPDFRGVSVLAAYRHIPALDIGIVAKVDMTEVREPFVRIALIGGAVTFAIILLGALIFIRFANPVLRRLREGEFVDTILSSAPQAIAFVDPAGHIKKVNHRFAGVYRHDPDDVEGLEADRVLVAEPERERFDALCEGVMRDGYAVADVLAERPDGSTFWVRLAAAPAVGLEKGAIVFSAEDVTEMKEAQEAIEAAEERYRRLVETASDLVWSVDASGRWTFLNAACEEIYGAPPDDLLGTPFMERIAPEDKDRASEAWGRVLAGGTLDGHETIHMDVHGERKTLSFSARATKNDDGGFGGAQGTARDVTERARAIEALNQLVEQRELLRSLINNTPDLVFYKDEQGVYQGCNFAFAEFVGLDEEEIVGQSTVDLFGEERGGEYGAQDAEVMDRDEPVHHEHWVEYPDGRSVLLDTLKTPFRGPDGARLGLIGISRDVTERKRIEKELEALADEARHANEMKSAFLANMSHEIRTPMNGVLGMTELLLETELDVDQRQAAELARTSAESLLQILDDILDFSKIEAGQLTLEEVPFDLSRVVDGSVRVLAVRAAERENELVMDVRPDVPGWVCSDPGRLRQVLTNLVSNAVKFTEGGEVVVRASLEGGSTAPGDQAHVRFSVRDTGIGIPEEKLESIFQEFVQADSSTTRHFGGTGLGLAISRKLVELLGGELQAESQPDQGSEFFFTLPLEAAEPRQERLAAPDVLTGRRVLVVDDHPLNRRIAMEHLSNAGVDVEEAPGAGEGLAVMREAVAAGRPFDAAVIDCLMPGMDGFDLAEEARSDDELSDTRLMMLTSAGRPGDAKKARDLGIEAYLIKPISRTDMIEAVAALLGRTGGEEAGFITRETVVASRHALTILVAEDNKVNQIVATSMLRSRSHTVDVVDNGAKALEAVRQKRYDLVLMDVQMPEMDGIEATRAIRAEEGGDLPIVALTAHALQEERERCLDAGMNDFLSKPFKPQDLFAIVNRWAVRREAEGDGDELNEAGAGDERRGHEGPGHAAPGDQGSGHETVAEDAAGPAAGEPASGEAPVDLAGFRATMREAGIEEVVDATIEVFLGEAEERTARLEAALSEEDAEEIASAAHALKSASRNIRALRLGDLLESLEMAGKDGDTAAVHELEPAVLAELERVTAFLEDNGY
jgi:PAS domain S-box-containing protein